METLTLVKSNDTLFLKTLLEYLQTDVSFKRKEYIQKWLQKHVQIKNNTIQGPDPFAMDKEDLYNFDKRYSLIFEYIDSFIENTYCEPTHPVEYLETIGFITGGQRVVKPYAKSIIYQPIEIMFESNTTYNISDWYI